VSEVPKQAPIARKYDSRHELEEVKSTEQMKEDVSIVVAFEETRRCTMQENHTILITLKHNEKDHRLHDEYCLYISGDWTLINDRTPEIKTCF